MRLIDAESEKLLNVVLHAISQSVRHGFKPDDRDVAEAKNIIDGIDTAYDIDKVIEELETLVKEYDERIERRKGECYFDENEKIKVLQERATGVERAIEIVIKGGVADDCCEWEKGSSGYVGYPAYYSKCCTTDSNGLEMQTHIIADWKYCPYCGKKIKAVDVNG